MTNNTKDFATQDTSKQHILHPDLAAQIEDEKQRPTLFTSLRQAWDALLVQNLQGLNFDDVPDLSVDDIADATAEFLKGDLEGRTAYGFEGLPFNGDVSIVAVESHEVIETTLTKVDDKVIIKVFGTVKIGVHGFIDKHEYYSLPEEGGVDVDVFDSDWNDHVMAVESQFNTSFDLSIYYSLDARKIVSHKIDLPQEINNDWYR